MEIVGVYKRSSGMTIGRVKTKDKDDKNYGRFVTLDNNKWFYTNGEFCMKVKSKTSSKQIYSSY